LGYTLDNPRTEEEIKFIKEYIVFALKKNHEDHKPNYNPMLSAAYAISRWTKYMEGRDNYVYNFFSSNNNAEIDDLISRCWIILRYDDNGEFEKVLKDKSEFFHIFFSEARHDYWEKYNNVQSYCQIASLLCHDDEDRYVGDSFILLKKPQDIFYSFDNTHEVIEAFTTFHGHCSIANDNRGKSWNFFPDVKDNLLSVSSLLEFSLKQKTETASNKRKLSPKEKILFVGDLLRIIENETHDVKVKLLLLASILEFLVTRNPDANRFNVEDSISRQFVLKTSILVYNTNPEIDLQNLKENLRRIYQQRSDVAHGNFISKQELKKVVESFYLLYKYIKAVTSEYIRDTKLVDYIKEN
jgi:hypothetical protein